MSMSYVEGHIRYNNTASLDIPEWYITKIEKEPVFVRLDIGFDKLRRHELHLMAMFAEAPCPVMRPATGFHADEHGGQGGDTGHQIMPGQALAQDDLAPLIHPDNVKDPLCDVDSQYAHRVFHWARLLWLHGFTCLEIILAHGSRSAQGAGPFHYDHSSCLVQHQLQHQQAAQQQRGKKLVGHTRVRHGRMRLAKKGVSAHVHGDRFMLYCYKRIYSSCWEGLCVCLPRSERTSPATLCVPGLQTHHQTTLLLDSGVLCDE